MSGLRLSSPFSRQVTNGVQPRHQNLEEDRGGVRGPRTQQRACLPSEEQSESNGHRHGNQGSVVSFSIRCAPGWKQCVTSPPRQAQAACRDGAWWPQTLVNIYPLRCRQAASPNPGSVGEGGAVPSEPAVGTHVATTPTNLHRNVAEGSMGAPWTLDRQPARARLVWSPPQTLNKHRLPPGAGTTRPRPPGALGAGGEGERVAACATRPGGGPCRPRHLGRGLGQRWQLPRGQREVGTAPGRRTRKEHHAQDGEQQQQRQMWTRHAEVTETGKQPGLGLRDRRTKRSRCPQEMSRGGGSRTAIGRCNLDRERRPPCRTGRHGERELPRTMMGELVPFWKSFGTADV